MTRDDLDALMKHMLMYVAGPDATLSPQHYAKLLSQYLRLYRLALAMHDIVDAALALDQLYRDEDEGEKLLKFFKTSVKAFRDIRPVDFRE